MAHKFGDNKEKCIHLSSNHLLCTVGLNTPFSVWHTAFNKRHRQLSKISQNVPGLVICKQPHTPVSTKQYYSHLQSQDSE